MRAGRAVLLILAILAAGRANATDLDLSGSEGASGETDQTYPNVQFFGRVFGEYLNFGPLEGAVPQGAADDYFSLHDSRIGMQGYLFPYLFFRTELGYYGNPIYGPDNSLALEDFYVEVQGMGSANVRVGNFVEPFSLERNTRKENLAFMERSGATQDFATERNWGAMIYGALPSYEEFSLFGGAFAVGYRDDTSNARNVNPTIDWSSWNFTGRAAWAPIYTDDGETFRLLHLGAGYTSRTTGNYPGGLGNANWEGKIPLGGFDSFIVDQLPAGASFDIANIEAAAAFGPFSVQAEYYKVTAEDITPGPDFHAHGHYVQGSVFLTGEHRMYDPEMKSFGGVHVRNPVFTSDGFAQGMGAIELAARFDFTDLNDVNFLVAAGSGTVSPTVIGWQKNVTLGLNWYLNDNQRLMFDWVKSDTYYTFLGNSVGNHFGARYEATFGF